VRLSSARDRKLFPDLYAEEQEQDDADVFAGPSTSRNATATTAGAQNETSEDDEDDEIGWTWEAEDDYTVRHVWPYGPDVNSTQHHLPGVSVHITANTMRVPPRKGIGNQPYVFRWRGSARGAICIAHLMPKGRADVCAGQHTSSEIFEDEQESDTQRLKKWNELHAFGRFLSREADRESTLLRTRDPLSPDKRTSTTNPLNSSPLRPVAAQISPLPPSSPPRSTPAVGFHPSSVARSDISSASSRHSRRSSIWLSALSLSSAPMQTPAPTHPAHARRVARASRRMERLTRSGLADMGSSEEEEEDELQGDELFAEDQEDVREGDVSDADDSARNGSEAHGKKTYSQWVGKGKEEDWDPFGEAEL